MTLFSWVSDTVCKLLLSASCRKPLTHHTSGNRSPASPYKDLCPVLGAACARFVEDIVATGQAIRWAFWFSTSHYHSNNSSYTPIDRHIWGCSTKGLHQKPLTNTRISTNCPKIYWPPQNSRCQKDDMQQAPYWECTNIRQCGKKCNHPGDQDLCTSADKYMKTGHQRLRNTITVLLVYLWPSTYCTSLLLRNSKEVVWQIIMLHKDNNLIKWISIKRAV